MGSLGPMVLFRDVTVLAESVRVWVSQWFTSWLACWPQRLPARCTILRLDSDEWSNCAPFTTFHKFNIRPRTFVDENQAIATQDWAMLEFPLFRSVIPQVCHIFHPHSHCSRSPPLVMLHFLWKSHFFRCSAPRCVSPLHLLNFLQDKSPCRLIHF